MTNHNQSDDLKTLSVCRPPVRSLSLNQHGRYGQQQHKHYCYRLKICSAQSNNHCKITNMMIAANEEPNQAVPPWVWSSVYSRKQVTRQQRLEKLKRIHIIGNQGVACFTSKEAGCSYRHKNKPSVQRALLFTVWLTIRLPTVIPMSTAPQLQHFHKLRVVKSIMMGCLFEVLFGFVATLTIN